eukprot:TCALIF_14029-PA protein Name:"Protein of unknown function" AED:0.08 eAED:0.08 QI:0/0/0.5/0.5/0/0.5/2/121/224
MYFFPPTRSNSERIMHPSIVATLAAASCVAEPEANAEPILGLLLRGGFGRHRGGFGGGFNGGYGGGRRGHRGYGGRRGYNGGYGHSYGHSGHYHKRSADPEPEAEAEAEPTYSYDTNIANPGYVVAPVAYAADYTPYNTYAYALDTPIAYSGAHFIGKREAEAEPGYRHGGGFGRGYGGGFGGGFGRGYSRGYGSGYGHGHSRVYGGGHHGGRSGYRQSYGHYY